MASRLRMRDSAGMGGMGSGAHGKWGIIDSRLRRGRHIAGERHSGRGGNGSCEWYCDAMMTMWRVLPWPPLAALQLTQSPPFHRLLLGRVLCRSLCCDLDTAAFPWDCVRGADLSYPSRFLNLATWRPRFSRTKQVLSVNANDSGTWFGLSSGITVPVPQDMAFENFGAKFNLRLPIAMSSRDSLVRRESFHDGPPAPPKETNINVIVRVRPRSSKEIRENSPIVVNPGSSLKSRELSVRCSPSDATVKTYHFDKVFGPDASQELVFTEVVVPLLDEVLMGYNCTIFAYVTLPKFIEIYNEELRDLLSVDDSSQKLKIFEDINRKGSNDVHGMERVLVTEAADVISILQKGSFKRQTAATKMNESSSRSHCIFTITVHIKETTADGEDLLKVGKLNLVDLAGSENIGRSGAENKRAKEAGSINQSLLALGRVINALVEKGPHVPYRESKLTRLLQDSLGGKTKTCIIAAVSPAKSNIEETLSTLDYAHRAKNIRNKPEVNQKMTKKALIKEYETQIERLKSDLQTYASLMDERQSRKDQTDEIMRQISAKEDLIKRVEDDFKENMKLLEVTRHELEGKKAELESHKQQLSSALDSITDLSQTLDEQKLLTEAHATAEGTLNSLAAGLVVNLQSSVRDLDRLHEKIDRKSAVESANLQIFQQFQNTVLNEVGQIEASLSYYSEASSKFLEIMVSSIAEFQDAVITTASGRQAALRAHVDSIDTERTCMIQEVEKAQNDTIDDIRGLAELARRTSRSTADLVNGNDTKDRSHFLQLSTALNGFADMTSKWSQELRQRIQSSAQIIESKFKAHIEKIPGTGSKFPNSNGRQFTQLFQISALDSQVRFLQTSESASAIRSKEKEQELLQQISSLVSSFASSQRKELSDTVAAATTQITNAVLEPLKYGSMMCSQVAADIQDSVGAIQSSAESVKDNLLHLQDCVNKGDKVIYSGDKLLEEGENTVASLVEKNGETLKEGLASFLSHEQARVEQCNRNIEEDSVASQTACEEWKISAHTQKSELIEFTSRQREMLRQTLSVVECNALAVDAPTGKTPRKRTFMIPTELVRTRDHAEILREFREGGRPPSTIVPVPISHISSLPSWLRSPSSNSQGLTDESSENDPPPTADINSLPTGPRKGNASGGPNSKLPRTRQLGTRFADSPLKELR
ncbi:hypothetical protein DFJ73DRAFT_755535 [Zopfochytrium polystomum]|nr:hypothetical protein DFJ73DRAFT_755535 [Zopfochytrium polystomum]